MNQTIYANQDDINKLRIVVGRIIDVQEYEDADFIEGLDSQAKAQAIEYIQNSHKVFADFGSGIGKLWSSLGGKHSYTKEQLVQNRLIISVLNMEPFPIKGTTFVSNAYIIGAPAPRKEPRRLCLLRPLVDVPLGTHVSWPWAANKNYPTITLSDFKRVELRVGLVTRIDVSSLLMYADFGDKWGELRTPMNDLEPGADQLVNKQIVGITNSTSSTESERIFLPLSLEVTEGRRTLIIPDRQAQNNGRIF